MNHRFVLPLAIVMALVSCSKGGGGSVGPDSPYEDDLRADLFDLSVGSDAIGNDASRHRCKVVTNGGFGLSSYYSEAWGRYVASFSGTPGATVGSGYYRVDYSSDDTFRETLAEGFSMEALFSAAALPSLTASVFSSLQNAGFGMGVSSRNAGSRIQFQIYTDKLQTLDSGISLTLGWFYHVIATWDKEEARMYVDGELVASAKTNGELSLPSTAASSWLCVGADCSSAVNYAENSWQGEVAIARLYGKPLSSDEVSSLYSKVKMENRKAAAISLTDVAFLTSCSVGNGYKYYVYANGLTSSDRLSLRNDVRTLDCETVFRSGCLIATIPAALTSGRWSLVLVRGDEEKRLGSVSFDVSDSPELPSLTKVFAHRCVHDNSKGPYENSLEALVKTGSYGVYGAEFDVWITTDGYVVVHHDDKIGGKSIQNSKWADIKNIKLSSHGEHLPLLSEFLDQGLKTPDLVLNFEIKTHSDANRMLACADSVAAMVSRRDMVSQCRVMSSSTLALDRLHARLPSLAADYIGTDDPSFAIGKGYNGIECNMNTLSDNPLWVSRCHEAGLAVCTWTPSVVSDMMTFINLGVDYMTVNNVDLAKTVTGRTYVSPL